MNPARLQGTETSLKNQDSGASRDEDPIHVQEFPRESPRRLQSHGGRFVHGSPYSRLGFAPSFERTMAHGPLGSGKGHPIFRAYVLCRRGHAPPLALRALACQEDGALRAIPPQKQ